jgi:TolA-binding protein
MEALTTSSIAQLEHLANEVIAMEEKADELRRMVAMHRQRQQQQQQQQQQQVMQSSPAVTLGDLSLPDGRPVPGSGLHGSAAPGSTAVPVPAAAAVGPPSYSAVAK